MIADVVRQALAGAGQLTGDVLFVGAAGAGREPERDELRKALRGENLAATVVVATDIEIALAAAVRRAAGHRRERRHRAAWRSDGTAPGHATGSAAMAGRWVTRAAATPSAAPRSAP